MIFAIAANIVAGLATVAFGWVDDKIGPKNVIMLSLTAMVVAGFGVFLPARPRTHRVLEPRSGPVCFCWPHPVRVAFLPVAHHPAGREGEVFGLYATTGRAVSFMAPAMYGLFLMIGKRMTPRARTTPTGASSASC